MKFSIFSKISMIKHFNRAILIAICGLCLQQDLQAQVVTFQDTIFRQALTANPAIDLNDDGLIQVSEANAYTGIVDVSGLGISDLTGIEAFVLIDHLNCLNNLLTSIDVSANTALSFFDCRYNQLTSLDISNNTALDFLACGDNQISTLDLSSNSLLTQLDCWGNQLTALDVSANTALTYLSCYENQITFLDVSANLALSIFGCYDNQLIALDVSANSALTQLGCHINQITTLDLSNNPALTDLNCSSNQLVYLNIQNGNNPNLNAFNATNNPILTCIQVDNVAIMNTNWSGAKDALANYNTFCDCIVNIPNLNFKNALLAISGLDDNSDLQIQCSEAAAYNGTIDVNSLSITDLTGIEAFTSMTSLDCSNNLLTSINIAPCTALQALDCHDNDLLTLNLISNTALNDLDCGGNQLSVLDLSNNPLINILYCYGNQLTNLDLSNNALLGSLFCNNNLLTSLDLNNNTSLVTLICSQNAIPSLDLSNCINLNSIQARFLPINSLDISANVNLTSIDVYGTNLTSLNTSNQPLLNYFRCGVTPMATLDFSNNPLLATLDAPACALTNLDLSNNHNLTNLLCADNGLSSLNIQNGNNQNLTGFNATTNAGLTCILVDNPAYMNANWSGGKDAGASFLTCCSGGEVFFNDSTFRSALTNNPLIDLNDDGLIQCTEASAYTGIINVTNLGINSMTGVEAFVNISELICPNNNISTINVSNNTLLTHLDVRGNNITSLDVSANTQLIYLGIALSPITGIDLSNNILLQDLDANFCALTSIDLSQNTLIETIALGGNNLSMIDVSANTVCTQFYAGNNPPLFSLNIKNGNNSNFINFEVLGNPSLTCIEVDNPSYMNTNWSAFKDANATFSLDCTPYITAQDGDWNTAATWTCNCIPPNDSYVTILHQLTVNSTVVEISKITKIETGASVTLFNNSILSAGNITNNGTITIDAASDAKLAWYGSYFNNNGTININTPDDAGNRDLEANIFTLDANPVFNNGETGLINIAGGFFDISRENMTFNNYGTIINNNGGQLTIGAWFNDAYFNNYATGIYSGSGYLKLGGYGNGGNFYVNTDSPFDVTNLQLNSALFDFNNQVNILTGGSLTIGATSLGFGFTPGTPGFNYQGTGSLIYPFDGTPGRIINRGKEWDETSGLGQPYNVTLFGGSQTLLNLGAHSTGNPLTVANDLTISGGYILWADSLGFQRTAPLIVGGNLIINGSNSKYISSSLPGGNLKVAGNITTDGTCDIITNGTGLYLNGLNQVLNITNPSTQIDSLIIEGGGVKNTLNDLQIGIALDLKNGNFDINSHNLLLGSTGKIVNENNDNRITDANSSGHISFNGTFGNSITSANNGNIGLEVTAASPIGAATIKRYQQNAAGVGAANSVNRIYEITTGSTLDASVTLNFLDNELNGNPANSNMAIFSSDNLGSNYTSRASTNNYPALPAAYTSTSNSNFVFPANTSYFTLASACIVTFQDSIFRNAVTINPLIDLNDDGLIQCTEAAAFNGTINVDGLGISDLTGIEAFTSLSQLLCLNNNLTALNVSANPGLTTLDCRFNQITALDVTNNINLYEFRCTGNQLTAIDVSNIPGLFLFACGDNQLTTLDVSSNTIMEGFFCHDNLLTSLDLSANPLLVQFWCYGNQLTALDVSNNPNLQTCIAYDNLLTSLNVSANPSLFELACSNNPIVNLDLSANSALTTIECFNMSALTGLNIQNGNNVNLGVFDATSNPLLFCIQVDNIGFMNGTWNGGKDVAASFSTDCSCIVNIPDFNFRTALLANSAINVNGDGFIQCFEANNFSGLLNVSSQSIADLTGIEAFTSLNSLDCSNNSITTLDVSNSPLLVQLNCSQNILTSLNINGLLSLQNLIGNDNQLTTINVSTNVMLEIIEISNNQLSSLDVSNNFNLLELRCHSNLLTSLNINGAIVLYYLDCNSNQLTNLDFSNSPALLTVGCENNQLATLDMSNCPDLNLLWCASNLLTSINVTSNPSLFNLACSSNQLTAIDVTFNPNLVYLQCFSNQLTALDVSNNSALQYLNCNLNQLNSLDVSNLTNLDSLFCRNNSLLSLDVSSNLLLKKLSCRVNQITNLDLSNNLLLTVIRCEDNFLTSLNIQNGNNLNLSEFTATNNPSLSCIQVDNVTNMNTTWSAAKDASAYYSTNCSTGIVSVQDGDWNTPSTWNCNCIPPSLADVTIDHAVTVTSNVANTTGLLTINAGKTLTMIGAVTLPIGDLLNNGTISLQTGDEILELWGATNINNGAIATTALGGTKNIDGTNLPLNSTFTNGGFINNDGQMFFESPGVTFVNDGTLSGVGRFVVANAGTNATFNNNGIINHSGEVNLGGYITAGGTFTIGGSSNITIQYLTLGAATYNLNNQIDVIAGQVLVQSKIDFNAGTGGFNYSTNTDLIYNVTGVQNKSEEWDELSGLGQPYNVTVGFSTVLNMGYVSTNTPINVVNDLNVSGDGLLWMDSLGFVRTAPLLVGNNLNMFGTNSRIILSSTGNLEITGNLEVGATSNVLTNNAVIKLRGVNQTINVQNPLVDFDNMEILGGGNKTLLSNLRIGNQLTFSNGNIDLNGNEIELDPSALIIGENNDNRCYSSISGGKVHLDGNFGNTITNANAGNLGLTVTAAAPIGNATISRIHKNVNGIGVGTSVERVYELVCSSQITAAVGVDYFDNDLNGNPTNSSMKIFSSANENSGYSLNTTINSFPGAPAANNSTTQNSSLLPANTSYFTAARDALSANFSAVLPTVCDGTQVDFTDLSTGTSGGTTYLWDFGDGNISNVAGDVSHTYSNPGLFTVSLTLTDGSTDTKTLTDYITVKAIPPAPLLSITDNCGSSEITASNFTGTLIWSDAGSGNPRTVVSGTYSVTQDQAGCISPSSSTVTANPLTIPSTSIVSGNATPNCSETGVGYSVTLTAGSNYAWSVPAGSNITAGAAGPDNNAITVDLGVTNGNISVVETNSSGCVGTQQDIAITLQGCGLAANFSADVTTICEGAAVTFTDLSTGTTGSTTYAWDFGFGANPPNATGAGPHLVFYSTAGAANVSLTVTEGASNNLTQNNYITINPPVAPTITISSDNPSPCPGVNFNLTANVTNGGTGYTIFWYRDGSGIGSGNTINTTVVNASETYQAEFQTFDQCVSPQIEFSNTFTAAPQGLAANPGINVSGSACPGSPIQFSESYFIVFGPVTPTSFEWKVNGVVQGTTTSPFITSTLNDGDLVEGTMFYDDGCGIVTFGLGSINAFVYPATTDLTINPTDENCGTADGSIDITGVVGGTGPYTYQVNGGGFSGTTLYSGLTAGIYTVDVQDINGCTYSELVTINSIAPPAPTLSITNNCGTSDVTASGFTGTLIWSDAGSGNPRTIASGSLTVTQDVAGCISASSNSVTANPLTVPAAPVLSIVDNCGSSEVTAAGVVGTLIWSDAGSGNPRTIVGGTLTATQDLAGCISIVSTSVTSVPLPIPSTSSITGNTTPNCSETNAGYSVTLTAGSNYAWSVPAGAAVTSGASGPDNNAITVDFATTNGNISVTETNASGCLGTQQDLVISLQGCALAANFTADVTTVCEGATVTFTDLSTGTTGGTTYAWDFGVGATPPTAIGAGPHAVVYSIAGTADVNLTITDGASDNLTNNNYITINTQPSAPVLSIVDNCGSSEVTAAGVVGTLIWSDAGSGNPRTIVGGTLTATQDLAGCISVVSSSVTSVPLPIPTTSAVSGNTTPNCSGTGVAYSVTLTAGSNYAWSVPAGAAVTSGATGPDNNAITVDFATTDGNISVVETNASGCLGTQQDLAVVLQGCGLAANFTADVTTVCEGATVTFTDLSTGTTGGTTYAWDFGAGATPPTAIGAGPHAVVYSTAGTADVSLTITDGASDNQTNNNYITINTQPSAPVLSIVNNCGSSDVTAAGVVGTLIWSDAGAGNPRTIVGGTLTATQDLAGCISAVSNSVTAVPLTVPAAPVLSIVDNCGSSEVTAAGVVGILIWSDAGSGNPRTIVGGTLTATQDLAGCISAVSNSVTSVPLTVPAAPVLSIVDNCGSSEVTAAGVVGTLIWSDAGSGNPRTIVGGTLTATQDLTGCVSAVSNSVTSVPLPIPTTSLITGNATPNCSETGVAYSVTLTAGSNYAWSAPGASVITSGATGPDNNAITVDLGITNGNISVTETNSSGCIGNPQNLAISLQGCALAANFTADVTTICEGATVTFTDLSTGTTGGTTYAWDFGAGATPPTAIGAGPHAVVYSTAGTVDVSLTVTDGPSDNLTLNNYITINTTPAAPVLSIVDNCGSSDVTAAGVVGTLIWSDAGSGNPRTIVGGTLTATQDLAGCISAVSNSVTSVPLTVPAAPVLSVVDNCGSSDVTAAGVVGILIWSDAGSGNPRTIVGGTLTATQDLAGCVSLVSNSVTSNPLPIPTTSVVSGNITPNCNEIGVGYSVIFSAGSSFAWTVPAGTVITSGAVGPNNNAITVDFASTSGNISVIETNASGCSGTQQDLAVALQGCSLVANFTADITSVCENGTVNFTDLSAGTSGSTVYFWDFGGGASPATATGAGPHAVVYSTAGQANVSLTITEGASDTQTQNNYITINTTPAAPVLSVVDNCGSSDVTAAGVVGTLIWSDAGSGNPRTIVGGTLTATQDLAGCISPVSNLATSNPLPVPATSVVSGNATPNCNETNVSYSVTLTAGSNYAWSVPLGAIITTGATGPDNNSITVDFSNADGNVSVIETNSAACIGTQQDLAVALQGCNLQANFSADVDTICDGATVTFTDLTTGAVGTPTYSWDFGVGANPPTATGAGPHAVVYSGAGQSTVVLTVNDVITSVQTFTNYITINALPTVANIGADSSQCGGSITLTADISGLGINYLWSNGGTLQSSTALSSGAYNVQLTDSNGCSSVSNTVNINIFSIPGAPNITPSGSTTFCLGDSVELVSDPAAAYLWSNGATTQSIYALGTGPYDVTITDANGCTAQSAQQNCTLNYLPGIPALGPDVNQCGGTVTLDAVVTGPGITYLWSNGPTTQTNVVSTLGTYYVELTNNCGTVSSDTVQININPFPAPAVITASGSTVFCPGGSVTLSSSYPTGNNWNTGSTNSAIIVNIPGVYNLTYIDAFGCSAPSNSISVSYATANIPVAFNAFSTLVTDSNLTAVFNNLTPNISQYNFVWYFGDGTLLPSNAASVTHSYAYNGIYSVSLVAYDQLNCIDTLTQFNYLTANYNGGSGCSHTANILPSGNISACSGSVIPLNGSTNAGAGATFQWNRNGVIIGGATQANYFVSQNGNYTLTVFDSTACPVTSASVQVNFNQSAGSPPVITSTGNLGLCGFGSDTLTATGGFASYLWSTGQSGPSIVVGQGGTYTVTGQSSSCDVISAPFLISGSTAPIPSICMITVDPTINKNVLVWEKPISNNIANFIIMREDTANAGVYYQIGVTAYTDSSKYIDMSSYANLTAYRYKMAVEDSCGGITIASSFHRSMHLDVQQGNSILHRQLTWNEYQNQPQIFDYHLIYRETTPNNFALLDSVPSFQTWYYDQSLTQLSDTSKKYLIAYRLDSGCDVTRAARRRCNSNSAGHERISFPGVGINKAVAVKFDYDIVPNPNNGLFNIRFTGEPGNNLNIRALDMLGNELFNLPLLNLKNNPIDMRGVAPGVYYIQIGDQGKRIIIK